MLTSTLAIYISKLVKRKPEEQVTSMSSSEKPAKVSEVYFGGSCACRRITYDCLCVPAQERSNICHCITCRKLSGGAFQVYSSSPSKQIIWYDNEEELRYEGLPIKQLGGLKFLRMSNIADRVACASCGSWLAMRYDYRPHQTDLTVGCVDEGRITSDETRKRLQIGEEIYCQQRAPWLGTDAEERRNFDFLPPSMEDALNAAKTKEG